jgi:hypothetical protein
MHERGPTKATCRPGPLRPQRRRQTELSQNINRLVGADSAKSTPPPYPSSSPGDEDGPGFLKKLVGESEYPMKFRLRRWFLFSGLVLGYSFYYLCRNSLNYVNPVMVADPALGLGITEVAAMTSIFPIAYGASSTPNPRWREGGPRLLERQLSPCMHTASKASVLPPPPGYPTSPQPHPAQSTLRKG